MATKTAYPAEKAESKTWKRKGRKKTLKVTTHADRKGM
jgi:hypothetical protein